METELNTSEIIGATTGRPAIGLESTYRLQSWLWQPNLIVFISSGCIMILELVAGRIIAPYVGVGLAPFSGWYLSTGRLDQFQRAGRGLAGRSHPR